MTGGPPVPLSVWRPLAALLILTVAAVAALTTGQASATPPPSEPGFTPECTHLEDFEADDFPRRPHVNNKYLPMKPGTRTVFEGTVDGVPHRVEFIVTDLVKKINGVRSLVIWDTDLSEDEVVESELSFFAQDEDRNVWNLGEYPEEYEGGEFVGAPNTWIAGEADAEAGIHMSRKPKVSPRQYIQGFAPEIDFFDCAKVVEKGEQVCVALGCFNDTLTTHETNLAVPEDGIQSKTHAPGIGIIQIGAVEPATGEVLELVERDRLNREEMKEAREAALELDARGYEFGAGYDATSPAKRLRKDDDDD
jgi:hypothetical protein